MRFEGVSTSEAFVYEIHLEPMRSKLKRLKMYVLCSGFHTQVVPVYL